MVREGMLVFSESLAFFMINRPSYTNQREDVKHGGQDYFQFRIRIIHVHETHI